MGAFFLFNLTLAGETEGDEPSVTNPATAYSQASDPNGPASDGKSSPDQHVFRFLCPSCKTPHREELAVCPQCGVIVEKFREKQAREHKEDNERRWHDNKWIVIAALILFFPVGLYALWKSPVFSPRIKYAASGVVAFAVLISALLPLGGKPPAALPSPKMSQEESRPPKKVMTENEKYLLRMLTKKPDDSAAGPARLNRVRAERRLKNK